MNENFSEIHYDVTKKSKIRNLFEKDKNLICIPFYSDNNQTLNSIALTFFKQNKISVSQENLNFIIERSRGSRQNLNNELNKIKNYLKDKNKINIEEILKLTNLSENYNYSELVDSCKFEINTSNLIDKSIYDSSGNGNKGMVIGDYKIKKQDKDISMEKDSYIKIPKKGGGSGGAI